MNSLLLDTHVWLWYVIGDETLKKPIRKMLNQASQSAEIHLASISLWEISMLVMKKRIILETPCLEWINKAINLTRTHILPLTSTIAVESCSLPNGFHEDPADRMIVATARVEGMSLLTRDSRILDYSKKKLLSTIKV